MSGRWIWLWGPVALYTGFIFWLSSESRPIPGMDLFPQMDKVFHFLEFVPYGALWIRALRHSWSEGSWKSILTAAFLGAVAVGALDEWYHSFVPIKESDFFDWSADAIGALVGQGLYFWRVARTP